MFQSFTTIIRRLQTVKCICVLYRIACRNGSIAINLVIHKFLHRVIIFKYIEILTQ
jgi:hypothetical protein